MKFLITNSHCLIVKSVSMFIMQHPWGHHRQEKRQKTVAQSLKSCRSRIFGYLHSFFSSFWPQTSHNQGKTSHPCGYAHFLKVTVQSCRRWWACMPTTVSKYCFRLQDCCSRQILHFLAPSKIYTKYRVNLLVLPGWYLYDFAFLACHLMLRTVCHFLWTHQRNQLCEFVTCGK